MPVRQEYSRRPPQARPHDQPVVPRLTVGVNVDNVVSRQVQRPKRAAGVHRERSGRGGKTVSVIKGVKTTAAGRKALLKHLKSKLGTGGTVKGEEIEIQGEQRERIAELLNELGYKAKVAGG